MLPKISIIIPIYNTEDYVVDCVASVVNQTYTNLEILLINDGSTDGSMDLIYQNFDDNRIVIINQENQGLSAARNTGIKYANGEYLFFVDSDDALVDIAIELLVRFVNQGNPDMIIGNYASASTIMEVDFTQYPMQKQAISLSTEEVYDRMLKSKSMRENINFVTVWGILYRKEIVERHLFPAGYLHEDEFVNYLYVAESSQIYFVDCPLYFYRDNPKGIVRNRTILNWIHVFDAFYQKLLFFRQKSLKQYELVIINFLKNHIQSIVLNQEFSELSMDLQIYYYSIYKAIFGGIEDV